MLSFMTIQKHFLSTCLLVYSKLDCQRISRAIHAQASASARAWW